jgi:nicotinate-nucleotide pyrophosphorylase (carboxylating)
VNAAPLSELPLSNLVRAALEEDRAGDDVTTLATVPESARGIAKLIARVPCVVAGLDAFAESFAALDDSVRVEVLVGDGAQAQPGDVVATVSGSMRAILSAERVALNFVQRLSGVATLTRAYVQAAGGRAVIKDTRKTTPGLRALERAAVRAGGGTNHRNDLGAQVLIKDNHIAVAGGVEVAVKSAKASGGWVEVECDTLDQVREAVEAGADEILLDNMDAATLTQAVALVAGRARTEASGGITLANVAEVAQTGVDSISVGALTHSAPAIDLSLEVEAI